MAAKAMQRLLVSQIHNQHRVAIGGGVVHAVAHALDTREII